MSDVDQSPCNVFCQAVCTASAKLALLLCMCMCAKECVEVRWTASSHVHAMLQATEREQERLT